MKLINLKYENSCRVCGAKLPAGAQAYLARVPAGGWVWVAACATHDAPARAIYLAQASRLAGVMARAADVLAQADRAVRERLARGEIASHPRWALPEIRQRLAAEATALEEVVAKVAQGPDLDDSALGRGLDRVWTAIARWGEIIRLAAQEGVEVEREVQR